MPLRPSRLLGKVLQKIYPHFAVSHTIFNTYFSLYNHSIILSHLKLGKLIALYDDNSITIDGDTAVSFTEDTVKRFESYGWHVSSVADGDNDIAAIQQAVEQAKAVTDKPSLIKVKTTIGKSISCQNFVYAVQQLHTVE